MGTHFKLNLLLIACAIPVLCQENPTWSEIKAPPHIKYSAFDFADSSNGCLISQRGIFVITTDGGIKWSSPETLQHCTQIIKLEFLTKNIIIAVDQLDYRGPLPIKLYISTNAGVSWTDKMLPDSIPQGGPSTISLLNENIIGFVSFRSIMYTSTNLGDSWDTLRLKPPSFLSCFHIFQPDNYFIGGGNGLLGSGYVSQSIDSGKTWTSLYGGTGVNSEYFTRSLGYFDLWYDDGNITTTATVLYNSSTNSKVLFENGGGIGALYDNGTYIFFDRGSLPIDQGHWLFTTTDSRHVWILTDSGSVFQRTDLLTNVSLLKLPSLPFQFSLEQNFPNPFNPTTTIRYTIPSNDFITLRIFDILGNSVAILTNCQQNAGTYSVQFDASHLTSGIYFCRLESARYRDIKKLVLLK